MVCASAPSACTSPAPRNTAQVETTTTEVDWSFLTLGPNDILRVNLLGHPELSTPPDGVRVDPQGGIFLQDIGWVHVSGKHVSEVHAELVESYSSFMNEPRVTVAITEYGSRTFHVLGNVRDPGTKVMDRPFNALEALSLGGIFLRGADRASVFLLRSHDDALEVHTFNAETPDSDGLVMVMPGDILYVRQKGTQDFQEEVLPYIAVGSQAALYGLTLSGIED